MTDTPEQFPDPPTPDEPKPAPDWLRERHVVQPSGDDESYTIEAPPVKELPKPPEPPPAIAAPPVQPAASAAAVPTGAVGPEVNRPYTPEWFHSLEQTLGATACRQLGFYAIPAGLKISVVIPVYNEEKTLEDIVDRVCAVPLKKEIVLVNDFSRDKSADIIAKILTARAGDPLNEIQAYAHSRNKGKGAALRTGFKHVTGDIVLIQDADLEYDPSEYPRLIQPIIEGKADVVFGSRFLGDQPHRVLYYWHYLANKMLTTLSNCFTNLNLTDMETCFKVFRREALQDVLPTLKQDRFGFEPEITAKIARRRYRVYEMSVSYSGRTYEQGKHIGWRDGFKALWCIFRYGVAD